MVYGINAALKNLGTTLLLRTLPPSRAHEQHSAIGERYRRRPGSAALHFRRRPCLQRAAFDHAGSQDEACRSTGPTCRRECPMSLGWVTMKTRPRPEPMARPGRALSRNVGRRPHSARRIRADSTDDSAALRRSVGTRFAVDAPWAAEGGRPATRAGDFSPTAPPGDFETAWNKFLHDGFAAHVTPKDQPPKFNGNTAGGVAHTLWSNEATVADERFAGDRARRQLFDG